jgi:serine/threonine protein kinase
VQLLQVEEKVRLDTLIEDLEANNIHYYPERDHNQFYLRLLHHSKDYRTLTLQVILGPFTTLINIFNETEPSYVHGLNCLYGSFGNVYLLSLLEWESEEEVAIKCIQFKDEDSQESLILRTIKEYTINKIASALKVGPKIIKIQEFDIVIYDKCIEFCMERCCLAEEYAFTEEDHSLLKLNLKKLHELKVVHCDIKASNLVYSKNFKAPVLLDFGFSKVLHTGPGTPTKTKYVGSLETCCKDMMKLYVSKGFGMVDLYFNDA